MEKIRNKKIIEYIEKNPTKNIAITGQNMSGKTQLFLDLLKQKENDNIYFLSCNNRTLNEETSIGISRIDEELDLIPKNILSNRIKLLENGIDKDVLGRGDNDFISEKINELFIYYYQSSDLFKEKLKQFMDAFSLSIDLITSEIHSEDTIFYHNQIRVILNEEPVSLSTGVKALIRLFVELWIAKENKIKEVYIDEIDMHLDQKNSIIFLSNLFDVFKDIRFVSIIHNMSIISGVRDLLIISLYGNTPSVFDSNEYLDLRAIANDIFKIDSIEKAKEPEIELKVNYLLDQLYNNEFLTEAEIKEVLNLSNSEELSFKAKDTLNIIKGILKK